MKDLSRPVSLITRQGAGPDFSWRLLVNADFADLFFGAGFDSFESLYDLEETRTIKRLSDRSVESFSLAGRNFYVKKHGRLGMEKKDAARGWCSEGGKEFVNLCDFRRHGLATAVPVAMGERVYADRTVESLLITEDFAPAVQLEYLIRHEPQELAGEEKRGKRKKILAAAARYARKMHAAGFNHRDFNATHLLLAGLEEGELQVALFDLQRVDTNRLTRFRWPVKALAELNYTLLEGGLFSDSERLSLYEAYAGRRRKDFGLFNRLQWGWIRAKTDRIARHTEKRRARRKKDHG